MNHIVDKRLCHRVLKLYIYVNLWQILWRGLHWQSKYKDLKNKSVYFIFPRPFSVHILKGSERSRRGLIKNNNSFYFLILMIFRKIFSWTILHRLENFFYNAMKFIIFSEFLQIRTVTFIPTVSKSGREGGRMDQ